MIRVKNFFFNERRVNIMTEKISILRRDYMDRESWRQICYFLGLTGNCENEPDASHYKSIELIIRKIEEES